MAQAAITLLVAAGFGLRGMGEALAACYGGGVTILTSLWLARQTGRIVERALQSPASGLGLLYSAASVRYGASALLLTFGLGVWKLAAVPMITAFGLAQLGFLATLWRD